YGRHVQWSVFCTPSDHHLQYRGPAEGREERLPLRHCRRLPFDGVWEGSNAPTNSRDWFLRHRCEQRPIDRSRGAWLLGDILYCPAVQIRDIGELLVRYPADRRLLLMGSRAIWRADAQQPGNRVALLAGRRAQCSERPGEVSEPDFADHLTALD